MRFFMKQNMASSLIKDRKLRRKKLSFGFERIVCVNAYDLV